MSSIKVLGIPQLEKALGRKLKGINKTVARAITKGAFLVQKTARTKIMKGPKTGIKYARGKGFHQASAAGEPPANDLGNLQRSINVVAAQPGSPVAYVNANTEYAAPLELGTKTMEPRPFMTPSVQENAAQIEALVKAAVAEALEEA